MEIIDKKISILIFFILLFTFIFFIPGVIGGDPFYYYIGTENFLKHFSVTIQPDILQKYDLGEIKLGVNPKTGAQYIAYGILSSIIMIPLYIVGQLFSSFFHGLKAYVIIQYFVNMTNCFICALTGVFLYLLLRRFGFNKKISLFLVLIYSFCTINFNYAVLNFGEPATVLLMIMAFYYLYIYKDIRNIKYVVFSSVFLGLALLIRFTNIILILPFLFYIASISGECRNFKALFKNIILYLLVFAGFVLILLVINYIKTGVFPSTGYAAQEANPPSIKSMFAGIAGFIISPGKSIFLFNLPLVLSLFYIKKFYTNFKKETIFIVIILFAHIFLYSMFEFWHGGLNWGPRYIMPIIVFLILPCAYALEDFDRDRIVRVFTIIIIIISLLIQLNSVLFSWFKFENEINIEKQFYSFKHSQIVNSFIVTSAYFYKKITGKDMFVTVDGKIINVSKLSKIAPVSIKILKGHFTRDNGEFIAFSPKIMACVYMFFALMLCIYIFNIVKLKKLLEKCLQ